MPSGDQLLKAQQVHPEPSRRVHPERSRTIQRMFGRIAGRYDLMNRFMSLGLDNRWRAAAASLARPRGALALDLGTGTGLLARQLHRYGAARVVAADFTLEMLKDARRNACPERSRRALPHSNVSQAWLLADAMRLPFPDNTFDCLANGFLLRSLPDLPASFREMIRVLKPGGRLVCLELSHPPPGWFGALSWLCFSRIITPLAGLLSGQPGAYRYLRQSLTGFPDARGLQALLSEAGLQDVRYKRTGFGLVALHWGTKGGAV